MKKRRQLKWSMIVILLVTWFIPLMLLSMILFVAVERQVNGQVRDTITISTDKAVELCQSKIDDVIVASKNSSYLPTVRNSYVKYLTDHNKQRLEQDISYFMSQQ